MAPATPTIDLNCDCGESFGAWHMGDDAAMLPWVSSANLACGFHAGDPHTMLRTVELCQQHAVAIGAHPGLRDLQGFGRRELAVSAADVYADTLYQVGALAGLCRGRAAPLHHVKPHGALYHQLDRSAALADAFVAAVRALDAALLVYGLPDGQLQRAAARAGLVYCREGFVERGYADDGRLLPRSAPAAVLHEPAAVVAQALGLALHGQVRAVSGGQIAHPVQTLCIHGDHPQAAQLARQIREALLQEGVQIGVPGAATHSR